MKPTDTSMLHLSPLELSNRTALDLDQVKAVVGQLRERGYLSRSATKRSRIAGRGRRCGSSTSS